MNGSQDLIRGALTELEKEARIQGTVLALRCGTGEEALYLASRGHIVWGVDRDEAAIDVAQEACRARGWNVKFLVEDPLSLERLLGLEPPVERSALAPVVVPDIGERPTKVLRPIAGRPYDTVVDLGFLPRVDPRDWPAYLASVSRVLRPDGNYHLICADADQRILSRMKEAWVRQAFATGWKLDRFELEPCVRVSAVRGE